VLPPTQERLEETRWLVDLQLGALQAPSSMTTRSAPSPSTRASEVTRSCRVCRVNDPLPIDEMR
jgi:hypothetical protein